MGESTNATSERRLTQPVQFLKGVGPQRAELLEKLGVRTVADLLFLFPRKYEDFTSLHQINELAQEQLANIVGTVDDVDQVIAASGKHVLFVMIKQGDHFVRATWFNQPFLLGRFQIGQRVLLRGKAKIVGGRFQMSHPKVSWLDGENDAEVEKRLEPLYPLTEGLNQRQIRQIVATAVREYSEMVEEAFPEHLRSQYSVCDIKSAIEKIHAPRDYEDVENARKRLVYQELFVLQLALAIRRHRIRTHNVAPRLELTPKIRARIIGRLPFELTLSQQSALEEIAADMGEAYPMNRLLHGDVGSGKTVVAVCAMMQAAAHGCQSVLMAPTEILAEQHFQTVSNLLANSRVRIAKWSGSLKTSERKQLAGGIESGNINIVIGTQAVVASKLKFANLGLAIVDEQHKFGVRQRALLKQSDHDPHYLVMTATPIPRTISMTLFGDLDVSILEKTTTRQKTHTYLGQEETRSQWWEFVRKKLRQGRQAFVVAPLVDSGHDSALQSAERRFETLVNGPFEEFRVDLIHGRQTNDEKSAAMHKFKSGQTQVLVATGLVEVGIDVGNATVMTIESAERFGLSQLHQLRGRVGRGQHPGFVCVYTSSDDPESNERLKAFAETENGFELAELDLQIRGPGNLFSVQQSGFPELRIADVVRDSEILQQAQNDARSLIESDPELEDKQLERLRQLVFARYGHALNISDVG